MRYLTLFVAIMLAFGCISLGDRTEIPAENDSEIPLEENITEENITENETESPLPPPPTAERYFAPGFSFEYPIGMSVEDSKGSTNGIFSASKELSAGQTGEIIVVTYMDTLATYGQNQDDIFKNDPTIAATDFLEGDMEEDPAGALLHNAYLTGNISTFAIARDGVAAEIPFKIRFGDSNKSYSGYAADLYISERSLHIKFRVIALDPEKAESIYEDFVFSFRLEQAESS